MYRSVASEMMQRSGRIVINKQHLFQLRTLRANEPRDRVRSKPRKRVALVIIEAPYKTRTAHIGPHMKILECRQVVAGRLNYSEKHVHLEGSTTTLGRSSSQHKLADNDAD